MQVKDVARPLSSSFLGSASGGRSHPPDFSVNASGGPSHPLGFWVTLLGPFAYPGVLGKVKIPWIFKDKSMLLWLFMDLKISK